MGLVRFTRINDGAQLALNAEHIVTLRIQEAEPSSGEQLAVSSLLWAMIVTTEGAGVTRYAPLNDRGADDLTVPNRHEALTNTIAVINRA